MITYLVYGTKHKPNTPVNWSTDTKSKIFHTIEEAEAWKVKNDTEQKAYLKRHNLPDWHFDPAFIVARGTIGELVEKFPNAEIIFSHRVSTFKKLLNTPAEYTPSIGKSKGTIEPLD